MKKQTNIINKALSFIAMALLTINQVNAAVITITNANNTAITGALNNNAWSSTNGPNNTMIWTNTTTGWTNYFASAAGNPPYLNGLKWDSSSAAGLAITGTAGNAGILVGTNPFVDVTSATGLVKLGTGTFAGTNGLIKKGAGTLDLQGATSTFTGGLTIEAGRVNMKLTNNVPISNNLNLQGGELFFNVASPLNLTFAHVTWGNGKMLGGPGSITASSYTITNNVAITNNYTLAGNGGLLKTGEGTFTLSSASTYTGTTTVNAGTLLVNGTSQSSSVVVNTGATVAGSGTLLNVVMQGGTLAPGNSPGLLSMMSLNADHGIFAFELGAPTTRGITYDAINVQSLLTLGENTEWMFTIHNNYTFQLNDAYDLFNWDSLDAAAFDVSVLQAALPDLSTASTALTWDVSEFTTSGIVSVIPEPSTLQLICLPFKIMKFMAVVLHENHKGNYMYAIPHANVL